MGLGHAVIFGHSKLTNKNYLDIKTTLRNKYQPALALIVTFDHLSCL